MKYSSSVDIPDGVLEETRIELLTSACYLLIDRAHAMNADNAKWEFDSINRKGVEIGDWIVTVTRKGE